MTRWHAVCQDPSLFELSFLGANEATFSTRKMPNKKKKNQARNPFYFFMMSLRPQLERQGVVLQNGLQSLAEIAGPRWKDLPEHEKEIYQEMAKQDKANKHFRPRNDKMDCTGEYISRRVDTVSLNEQRRKQEQEEVKRGWTQGKAVCDEKFYMVGFMSCYELPDDGFLPCELGAVEYSLNEGILRKMHYFIQPGEIKLGLRYAVMSTSERTHKIPVEGLAKKEDTYRKIWLDLLRFVNPEQTAIFPPVYCRISETKQTEFCLQWLARKAEMPNKLKKVYELEGLISDLHSHHSSGSSGMAISKSKATELISSTIFDYEPNTRCDWHEKQEVKYCALGTVLRYCYCMSDFLCTVYRIPLTPSHLPERPEGTFCTELKAPENRFHQEETRPSGFREAMDDNGPFASRDYRYYNDPATNEGAGYAGRYGMYTRSGPTYDEQSLQHTADDDEDAGYYGRQQQSPSWQLPQQPRHLPSSSSAPGLGRGRGRGRGVPLNQPLRRPNVGVASGSVASQASPWSSRALVTESPHENIPSLAKIEHQQSYVYPAGRGALRTPASNPQVYAGAMAPPLPIHAPMPPAAWQQQLARYDWQGVRGLP